MTHEVKAIISKRILSAIDGTNNIQQAIDKVLGAGTYAKLAGEVYDELRERRRESRVMLLIDAAHDR